MSKKIEMSEPVKVTQRDVEIALERARQMRAQALRHLGAALWRRIRAPFGHARPAGRAAARHA